MDLNDLQALMGEPLEAEDHRDLWVIDTSVETQPAASLLGEARRMADSLGAYVHYVGPADPAEAIAFGADRVHPLSVESGDAALAALAPFFEAHKPEFVFLPAAWLGNELAGRLAQRLRGGAVFNCIALRLDESTRELVGSHPVYDGAYYLDTAITRKPAIVTVQPGVLAAPLRDPGRTGEVESLDPAPAESRVRALGPVDHTPPAVSLHKAARVVAVGRSGNDAGSVEAARAIAGKIGAHFAGDRSAFDSGWVEQDQIVGVIGTEIAPDLYIAAGIWGDTLHRAAVEGAKYVIAIHPNKNAPIFQYADAVIVGAPKDVLPKLLALL
jgi:electron transfer flavoprotein alpha subunit